MLYYIKLYIKICTYAYIYMYIYNICIYLTFSATPKVWHLLLTSLERSKIYSSNIHELHASKDTTNDELAQMIFQKASHWDHRTTYVAWFQSLNKPSVILSIHGLAAELTLRTASIGDLPQKCTSPSHSRKGGPVVGSWLPGAPKAKTLRHCSCWLTMVHRAAE